MTVIKSDRSRLRHILDAIETIWEHVKDSARDKKTRDAVIRQLEIIGEASRHVSPEIKQKYPHIPWRDIINMRHQLSHGYFQIDLMEVWDTVDNDLLPLQEAVLLALKDSNIM